MSRPGKALDRERAAVSWKALSQVTSLATEARAARLDALAYLLDMVALEARQHVSLKNAGPVEAP
jgi:hypothetical protein